MFKIVDSIFVLCLTSIVLVNSQHDHQDHQVDVAVYYEAMCSDSIKFVTTQLYPALQIPEVKKHINLTFVPFGKTTIMTDQTGDHFQCHHGPAECKGNKIHACALEKIPANNDSSISNTEINFVYCLLKTVVLKGDKTEFETQTCATQYHVDDYAAIDNCAGSHEGKTLLKKAGETTKALQAELKAAPTIVFDNKLDQAESSEAEKDFIKVLCKHIQHDKPAECEKNSANTHISFGISLLLFITYLIY